MRRKDEAEKVFESMAYLEGPESECFFERFTRNATLTTECVYFAATNAGFVENVYNRDTLEETIRHDME